MTLFEYETPVHPDWIDYNGHMRDAYYGLVFSYAVDAFQDAVGIDQAYRDASRCTLYQVEDHKFYLAEVKLSDLLRIETRVLDCSPKMIQLHLTMLCGSRPAAVAEFLELHVSQATTPPRAAPMPDALQQRLEAARCTAPDIAALAHRARPIAIRRRP